LGGRESSAKAHVKKRKKNNQLRKGKKEEGKGLLRFEKGETETLLLQWTPKNPQKGVALFSIYSTQKERGTDPKKKEGTVVR